MTCPKQQPHTHAAATFVKQEGKKDTVSGRVYTALRAALAVKTDRPEAPVLPNLKCRKIVDFRKTVG